MRKRENTLFVCCRLLIIGSLFNVFSAWGASYGGMSVGLMSSWQMDNFEKTHAKNSRPLFGFGADVALHYHLVHNGFLFDTGVGVSFARTRTALEDMTIATSAIDNRGVSYTIRSNIKDRVDAANATYFQVPLMFGAELNGFYFLVGGKFNMNVWGNTKQVAMFDTEGVYAQFSEPFRDMPQHGFHDFERTVSNGSIRFNYDVLACLEAGWTFDFGSAVSTPNQKLRVGLFFETSILDINKGGGGNLAGPRIDTDSKGNNIMHPVLTYYAVSSTGNEEVEKCWLRNMNVGIRMTYLIRMKAKRHRKCMCEKDYW